MRDTFLTASDAPLGLGVHMTEAARLPFIQQSSCSPVSQLAHSPLLFTLQLLLPPALNCRCRQRLVCGPAI
jgi:hypothetical protein